MEFQTYLSKPVKERIKIISQQASSKTPFWQERLNTAIAKHSPSAVSFDKRLVNEYWNIMHFKNNQF